MAERNISPKQIEAILKLDGPSRYDHFIKHVADCEQAWGLYADGWAMGINDEGVSTFQLWPAKEYAALCIPGGWIDYEPSEISVNELLEELLPTLRSRGIALGIFRTPGGDSVMPTIDQLESDLRTELSRYE